VIFAYQNLITNWLTNLVPAKSTGELISFGFSDRSVGSLVSASEFKRKMTSLFGWSLVSVRIEDSAKVSAKDQSKKWNDPLTFFLNVEKTERLFLTDNLSETV